MKISARKWNSNRTAYCRWEGFGHHIKKGQKYLAITGKGAGGYTTLCVCEDHLPQLFNAIKRAKVELKKL